MSISVEVVAREAIGAVVQDQRVQQSLYRLGYDAVASALPMAAAVAAGGPEALDGNAWQVSVLQPVLRPVVAGARAAAARTVTKVAVIGVGALVATHLVAFLLGRASAPGSADD
jgi:hypothetical protein